LISGSPWLVPGHCCVAAFIPGVLAHLRISQDAQSVDPSIAQQDQRVWSLAENFAVFVSSLKRLSDRLEELKANVDIGNAPPVLTFDKDDVDTLDFVAASANLRSLVFGIELRSRFDIKRKPSFFLRPTSNNPLTRRRNGWQHHPGNRNNQRHDRWSLRPSSVQGDA